jgi:hypothetical protein
MDNMVDEILKHTHCGKDENTTRIALHGVAMGRRKTMNHRVDPSEKHAHCARHENTA